MTQCQDSDGPSPAKSMSLPCIPITTRRRTSACDFVFMNQQRLVPRVYLLYHTVRFQFDAEKSARLRSNPKRGIGFEEAGALWERPYYLDRRSDAPEQFRAIGWVDDRLYSVIFEVRGGCGRRIPSFGDAMESNQGRAEAL